MILCILLTWWIGHCLQLISIHSFARHFVALVAKHRARKSAHTYFNRPISILDNFAKFRERRDDRQLPPSLSKFPLSLSLSLISSFLLSFYPSISEEFRRSFVDRAWNFLDRLHYDSKSVTVSLQRSREERNSERIASLASVFGYAVFSFSFSLSNEISISEFFHATNRDDARGKIIAGKLIIK